MYSLLLLGISAGLLLCLLLQPIEVADVIAVLDNAKLLELAQGVLVGLGFGDVACAVEDLAVVQVEEGVKACGPVLHRHGDLTAGTGLGQIKKGVDQAAEVFELVAGEVVLADGYVTAQDLAVGAVRPVGQAHVGLVGPGAGGDELGGGVAVDGVVELVLNGGEEALGGRGVLVVVDAGGVDVGDLLVEATFGQADLADLIKQALEVVSIRWRSMT